MTSTRPSQWLQILQHLDMFVGLLFALLFLLLGHSEKLSELVMMGTFALLQRSTGGRATDATTPPALVVAAPPPEPTEEENADEK